MNNNKYNKYAEIININHKEKKEEIPGLQKSEMNFSTKVGNSHSPTSGLKRPRPSSPKIPSA